ncbi:MAG: DUF4013 domain-containing protein [Anaerolineales bacterium]|nr:DUF4013 domain-containing protein [Anaerolineales bacterium]
MDSQTSLEEIKKNISFPFRGSSWGPKALIGSALSLGNFIFPLLPLIPLLGYAAQVMKQILRSDQEPSLPEWSDWNAILVDGLKVLGVQMLYGLPGGLLYAAAMLLFMAPAFVMPLLTVFSSSQVQALSLFPLMPIAMILAMILMLLGTLAMLGAMVLIPPSLGHMVAKNEFSAAFRVREWWPVFKANLVGFSLTIVLLMGLSVCATFVVQILYFTLILCVLIPFALSFLSYIHAVLSLALYAIAYRDGTRNLAEIALQQQAA